MVRVEGGKPHCLSHVTARPCLPSGRCVHAGLSAKGHVSARAPGMDCSRKDLSLGALKSHPQPSPLVDTASLAVPWEQPAV